MYVHMCTNSRDTLKVDAKNKIGVKKNGVYAGFLFKKCVAMRELL